MNISVDFFFDDVEEMEIAVNVARIRKRLRDNSNPLELPESKFISYFRINKPAFCYLLDEVKPHLKRTVRGNAISPVLKLCCALRFFAEGSYQKCSGNDFNIGFAQPTVSHILKEVLKIMEERVCSKWVQAQMTPEKKTEAKQYFYLRTGLPGVISCIDGTHVKIIAPKKNLQHMYLNRKGYYSLNVMIMYDHEMKIRYVDARHPGANHYSFIWNTIDRKEFLKNDLGENTWILGDAGYPLEPFLMTPFRMTVSGSPESQFNTMHAQARNIVERTIGVLKNTYRCLLSARGLHYSPAKATQIVNACCALYNINKEFKTEFPEEPTTLQDDLISVIEETPVATASNTTSIALEIRNNLMRNILNQ